MLSYFSINGTIFPSAKATIRITDLSILRGFAIFDFLRSENGKPVLLDDYLDRFQRSAEIVGLPVPLKREAICEEIYKLLQINAHPDCGVRLVLTGGYSLDGFAPSKPNLLILNEKLHFPEPSQYQLGVSLIFYEYKREWSEVKSTNYFSAVKMLPQLRKNKATDILYHYQGTIFEASRSNFFIIKNGTIVTPSEGILKGITRKTILSLAKENYKIELRPIQLKEIEEADEAFITSTTKKILPVTKIDEVIIGNGKPGKISKELIALYSSSF